MTLYLPLLCIHFIPISDVSIGSLIEELQRQKMKNAQVCALTLVGNAILFISFSIDCLHPYEVPLAF